jgi:hypothetical protein
MFWPDPDNYATSVPEESETWPEWSEHGILDLRQLARMRLDFLDRTGN